MLPYPWVEFTILELIGLLAILAVLPFTMAVNHHRMGDVHIRNRWIVLALFLQNALVFTLALALGLPLAHAVGRRVALLDTVLNGTALPSAWLIGIVLALIAGAAAALINHLIDQRIFAPGLPADLLAFNQKMPHWKRLLSALFAFAEETMLRMFLLTVIAWAVGLLWKGSDGYPAAMAWWIAILISAFASGLERLATVGMLSSLTLRLIGHSLLLDGLAGVLFGLFYWQYGFEAAVACHLVYEVVSGSLTGRQTEVEKLCIGGA